MTNQQRERLALRMVSTLPRFGDWARSFRDFETPSGKLGFRQLAILWALRYELLPDTEMTPTRLAEMNHVQPSVITRALDKLAAGGYITRTHDEGDRRRIHIVITEKGLEASVHVERLYIDEIAARMSHLSDEQIDSLACNIEILGDIVTELEDRRTEHRGNSHPPE